jgi:hypothetical protein
MHGVGQNSVDGQPNAGCAEGLNHKRDGLRYRLIEELTDGGIGCRSIGCPSIFLLSEGLSSFLLGWIIFVDCAG